MTNREEVELIVKLLKKLEMVSKLLASICEDVQKYADKKLKEIGE